MQNESSPGFQLRLLYNAVKRKLTLLYPYEMQEGCTHLHSMIVHFLAENGDRALFQKDVENEFCIRRSTASTILKLMEKKGLIRRESVPQDGRLKQLILTEQAWLLQQQMENCLHQVDEALCRDIPRQELEIFFRVLQQMQQNMDEKKGRKAAAGGAEDP
ncbi:MAG: MarR family transcriptional regulator [Bacillota bacterium]|nr:MarR family transcriptional regulator [Bacillota bacterium]